MNQLSGRPSLEASLVQMRHEMVVLPGPRHEVEGLIEAVFADRYRHQRTEDENGIHHTFATEASTLSLEVVEGDEQAVVGGDIRVGTGLLIPRLHRAGQAAGWAVMQFLASEMGQASSSLHLVTPDPETALSINFGLRQFERVLQNRDRARPRAGTPIQQEINGVKIFSTVTTDEDSITNRGTQIQVGNPLGDLSLPDMLGRVNTQLLLTASRPDADPGSEHELIHLPIPERGEIVSRGVAGAVGASSLELFNSSWHLAAEYGETGVGKARSFLHTPGLFTAYNAQ